MSQENVKIVEGLYAAFGRGDIPNVMGALDPKIEWWEAENFIYAEGNPYVGHDAVLQGVFMRIGADWDGFTVSPAAVFDAGEAIISQGYYSGTHRKTGRQARAQFAHFFTVRDGKIVRFQQYTDTAQFKEVAGG